MAPYTKPETVLRRSEELLSVNQPMSALASISEIFSSKRFRQTPLSSLEPIMLRFIDLCVMLRKTRNIKEGLHMYKNVAQNTSVSSVEVVIQHFITRSKEKLNEALAKVEEIEGPLVKEENGETGQAVVEVVDDLEATETPESLLLSTVSEEKSRDRTYRELVTPCLRSLWEAYRTALDILRNNARLEIVYQQVASEAFEFCLAHDRKTEFRRLSETLRSNLASSQKYSNQAHSINLSDPEVLQRHLETRFQQLNTSVSLELWQESFRTAEDINGLISLSKKVPKNHVMSSFYEKMIKVFGVGENHLFHAAAYNKYFAIQSNALNDQPEKLKKLASLVMLSALSVPSVSSSSTSNELSKKNRDNEDDTNALNKTKSGRLATLLGLNSLPTRSNLLKDAIVRGALKKSSSDIHSLYEILEVDFHPLSITSKIQPILQRLGEEEETMRYVEPLKEVVLTRLFQQLSQVYDSLKLSRIIKLAAFGMSDPESLALTRIRVEKFLMEACRRGELEVTLDHSSQLIRFADRMFENGMSSNQLQTPSSNLLDLTSGQEIFPSQTSATNSFLQPNSATLLRSHLTRLASALTVSLNHIIPALSGTPGYGAPCLNHNLSKATAIQILQTEGPKQRKALLKRKITIEERKRKVEEKKQKQDMEEAKAKALRIIQIQEEQQIRLQKQNKEREIKKLKDEADKIRAAEAEKVALALAAQAGLNVDIKNLKGVDTNTIIQMGVEQIEKERKELAAKLKIVNKRLDHTERALRREELPLLKDDHELQLVRDETTFRNTQAELLEGLKAKHSADVEIKHKLEKIMPDFLKFKESVAVQRGHDYKRAQEEARIKIEKAKAERKMKAIQDIKAARARKREEERLAMEREEQEKIRKEEEEKLEEERKKKQVEIEEQEKAFRAVAEAKAKALREERERERAEAAEVSAKQAQREAEAIARREAKKTSERIVSSPAVAQTASTGEAKWRRSETTVAAADLSSRPALPSSTIERPTTSRPEEARRPIIPGAAEKKGGWRERMAAKGEDSSGYSTPVGSLSRNPSGAGTRRASGMDNPKDEEEKRGGFGSYRPPQSREGGGGSGNNSRPASGRGTSRW
ncbi:translation initiation factor eIF3a [Phakopsora pachyrhizi]|uniref:Eukaryotic translation initiation factor 3 subunit A n=1 Tax=Phakopsora pachyrhizi TaxID=170000 RepID=A0AAV0AL19_PHAPC|nr:translation initiation factor eIF3a [Phakopsora pachyrhizi]CAH7668535.1 translation initiation factor eIF3a [Phakopsora pachyrhizi]